MKGCRRVSFPRRIEKKHPRLPRSGLSHPRSEPITVKRISIAGNLGNGSGHGHRLRPFGRYRSAAVAPEPHTGHNSRVMANFSIAAPVESEKTTFLHDRSSRPVPPETSRMDLLKRWTGFILGLALSVGLTAVLFSLRDSWENHREWLVTVIPVLVIAGVGLGHLLARRQVTALGVGGGLLFLTLLFTLFDIIADNDSGSTLKTRDVLSIIGGVCLGFASVALIATLVWVEMRNPTKAPKPEL